MLKPLVLVPISILTYVAQTPTPILKKTKSDGIPISTESKQIIKPNRQYSKTCKPFPNGQFQTVKCSDGSWQVKHPDGSIWQGIGELDPRVVSK